MEKNAPIIARFQERGFEVVGFDLRCFGRSHGLPRGLIDDTETLITDARNFLSSFDNWDSERGLGQ